VRHGRSARTQQRNARERNAQVNAADLAGARRRLGQQSLDAAHERARSRGHAGHERTDAIARPARHVGESAGEVDAVARRAHGPVVGRELGARLQARARQPQERLESERGLERERCAQPGRIAVLEVGDLVGQGGPQLRRHLLRQHGGGHHDLALPERRWAAQLTRVAEPDRAPHARSRAQLREQTPERVVGGHGRARREHAPQAVQPEAESHERRERQPPEREHDGVELETVACARASHRTRRALDQRRRHARGVVYAHERRGHGSRGAPDGDARARADLDRKARQVERDERLCAGGEERADEGHAPQEVLRAEAPAVREAAHHPDRADQQAAVHEEGQGP
jgi:hypothetical protein